MKTLLVKSTILPTGERITWDNGMPVHYSREMIPEQYNAWQSYIDDQIMKIRRWTKLLKKPKVHFHEDPEPESDRMFWAIMFAMILLAMFFIIGIFVSFYLKII
jgi:hypothetical protein